MDELAPAVKEGCTPDPKKFPRIDGSAPRASKYMLAAHLPAEGPVLMQVAVDGNETEIVAAHRLPDRSFDKNHGGREWRTLTTSSLLNDSLGWPGLGRVFRLERCRVDIATGEESRKQCMASPA
jgi:hypothetical protein